MKVSLVATVKDAGPAIDRFLASLAGQTRAPDEVVVVDGGSTDGTLEALRATGAAVTVLSAPGTNIAEGRNRAVAAASHEVLAVTDPDCELAPDWLERLLAAVEGGADVAAGVTRPVFESLLQEAAASVVPDPDELGERWMPSSRSLALRREVFEAVGGYPEWLEVGEDMYLNHRLVDAGARIAVVPGAVVYWTMRPTVGDLWAQYVRYAEGDALAGMHPRRHAVRFAAGAFAAVALSTRRPALLAAAGLGFGALVARPLARAWRRRPAGFPGRAALAAGVPATIALIETAKAIGYVRGLARRRTRDRVTPAAQA
jgi:hypothetical protein